MDKYIAGLAGEIGGSLISSAAGFISADRQMKFQERMSNTAHQREIQDLIKAGINPIYTANGSGASQPMGARVEPENPMRGTVQALISRDLAKAEIANKKADTELKQQQANESSAKQYEALKQADYIEQETNASSAKQFLDMIEAENLQKRWPLIDKEGKLMEAEARKNTSSSAKDYQEIAESRKRINQIVEEIRTLVATNQIKEAEAKIYQGWMGYGLHLIKALSPAIGTSAVGAALLQRYGRGKVKGQIIEKHGVRGGVPYSESKQIYDDR